MNALFRKVAIWGCSLLAAMGLNAGAAPQAVEPFDGSTWRGLQASLERPMAVVFSTTDCVHCPAAIETLAREIRQRQWAAALVVVVMDRAPGEDDVRLMRNAHYRPADRLFVFSGQSAALRYSVDPGWRGVTPFIALLVPHERPVWVTGIPRTSDVVNWVKAGSAATPSAR